MKQEKTIGWLLIAGAIGVLIPYTVLTFTFNYPDILRQGADAILTRFHAGGPSLVLTWWAFSVLGLPLLVAYILIGQMFESRLPFVRWATTVGVVSIIAQLVGLLRWVFVVPLLARKFVGAESDLTKAAVITSFETIHQFGGVLLGEHIGQLFTIVWTVMITLAFRRLAVFPNWLSWFGMIASAIYLLAQAELFATVIPGFPTWSLAGFIGSTLWLLWILVTGIMFLGFRQQFSG